jgi:hypothetical protein
LISLSVASHAIAPRYPLHEELPTAVAFTDEGKAEEVEGFRLSEPTLGTSICRKVEMKAKIFSAFMIPCVVSPCR